MPTPATTARPMNAPPKLLAIHFFDHKPLTKQGQCDERDPTYTSDDSHSGGTMPTISGLLRSTARRVPKTTALKFDDRTYTYAELDAEVDRVAHALSRLGLAKGDRFALMATNSDHFVISFYAALRVGAVALPINPTSASPELN